MRPLAFMLILDLSIAQLGCAADRVAATTAAVARSMDAKTAIHALQASRFEEAERLAKEVLAEDGKNARAHLVVAITRYKGALHDLFTDLQTIFTSWFRGGINQRYLRWSLRYTEGELEAVERHLAAAAEDPAVSLELCLACFRVDWNRSGQLDERDQLLFEIELDADQNPIPEGDPRRTPTFRFDYGDVYWARAMVAFQRSLLNLLLAYRLPSLGEAAGLVASGEDAGKSITIQLEDQAEVHRARDLILEGLAHADRSRREYLAEPDDDREWLPNPRQKNHPLPLPVDEQLYQTWEGMLQDLRHLIAGEEGVSVAEVAQLGDHQWQDPPQGYIHIGRLLAEPGNLVLDVSHLERLDRDRNRENVERVLKDVFGDKYLEEMKPTRLISRLLRMKKEIERGEESLGRKLRYLLWLN